VNENNMVANLNAMFQVAGDTPVPTDPADEPPVDLVVAEPADTDLEPAEKSVEELELEQDRIDAQADHSFARDSIKDTIKTTSQVLNQAAALAMQCEEPKAVEAYSKLVTALVDANERLMNLHQKKQEFKQTVMLTGGVDEPEAPVGPTTATQINANTIVFTGTSKEILDVVNLNRR
jgi:hypothetical protein